MYFCLYMRLWLHLVLCVAYSSGRANCQWKWCGRVGSGGIPVLHRDVKQRACENRKLNYMWVEFWPSPAPLVGYQWGRKVHALGQCASGQINMGWIWIRHRMGSQSGSEPYGEGRVSGPTLSPIPQENYEILFLPPWVPVLLVLCFWEWELWQVMHFLSMSRKEKSEQCQRFGPFGTVSLTLCLENWPVLHARCQTPTALRVLSYLAWALLAAQWPTTAFKKFLSQIDIFLAVIWG